MEERSLEKFLSLAESCDFVRWVTTDNSGNSRMKATPGKACKKFVKGKELCVGLYTVSASSEDPNNKWLIDNGFPDFRLVPEPSTFHFVPWTKSGRKVGQVLCRSEWRDGSMVEGNPRSGCVKLLGELKDLGFNVFSALEFEWRLFKPRADGSGFDPIESRVDPYCGILFHKHEKILYEMSEALTAAGLDVEALHTEFGSGQMEITMSPKAGIRGIDEGFLYRQIIKEVALNNGLLASFISTPFSDQAGSGLHYNHSLWSPDMTENKFFNQDKPEEPSETMQHWLGGLVEHAAAITALTSPTTNCYRRLHKPFTPNHKNWDLDSREATYRVKLSDSKGANYVENRLPSAAANPYAVASATLAAGLDGIRRKLEPPKAGSTEKGPLPFTMEEALEELQKDTLIVEAVGPQFVDFYVGLKKEIDMKKMQEQSFNDDVEKLEFEMQNYLEFY